MCWLWVANDICEIILNIDSACLVLSESSGAHNPERATPILGLCRGVLRTSLFLDPFQGSFFPRNKNLHHVAFGVQDIKKEK